MPSAWKQFFLRSIALPESNANSLTPYAKAKGKRAERINTISILKDVIMVTLGVGCAAFGLEGFLLPNSFIDGGATGISLLITEVTSWPLPIILVVVNLPFIYAGYKAISPQFAFKTLAAIVALAICLLTLHFPEVTDDKLLVAVFGGFFLGAGIGLSIRGGAVLDGTEVLAIALSRKLRSSIGDIIIVINAIIFSVAAYLLSIESALYSMITYLAASKTLDFVIEGIEEYMGVTIISSHSNDIRIMVISVLGRGVTVYKGKGGFDRAGANNEIDILFTVITRLELSKLNTEIEKIDPNAFIVTGSIKDTKGGMIKKRSLKH